MKLVLFLIILIAKSQFESIECRLSDDIEGNEFAEFEDFEEEDVKSDGNIKENFESVLSGRKKVSIGTEEEDVVIEEEVENDDESATEVIVKVNQSINYNFYSFSRVLAFIMLLR